MALRTVLPILCLVLAAGFAPASLGQNGPAYYVDVNGTTPGFGNPAGLTINGSDASWTTDPTGTATPTALPTGYNPAQLTFGHSGTLGISNSTFSVSSAPFVAGIVFNCPCQVTIPVMQLFSFLAPQTWLVPAGSSLTFTVDQYRNWAFDGITMQGGGTINFNCPNLGRNGGFMIQDMTNGTVNLFLPYTDPVRQTSYELRNGTLNFTTAASAGALGGPATATPQYFKLSGGALDNTSGSALTLNLGADLCQIGGSFTFIGGSSLNLGTNTFDLGTVTPAITVLNNTLEFDGTLTNTAGLTKAGAGTLVLSGMNLYGGNTLINAGKLALSGSGTLGGSPLISIAGGATLDVSGLGTAATLASGKVLQAGGSTSSATLATAAGKGLTLSSTSPLQFTAFKPAGSGGAVPLILSGAGTLTLGTATPVTVTVANGGTPLTAAGSPYKLIAKGANGTVATLPGGTLTVNGDGSNGSASLAIINGELYLVVTGSSVSTTTALVLTSGGSAYGNNKIFTATVTTNGITAGNATGNFIFSVDGIAMATNTISGGSANFTVGGLAVGSHLITAQYGGDSNYKPGTYALTQAITPLAVGLTGARAYDGTTNAAYGILAIANIVGGDDVFPASGSVGLAGSAAGNQAITSANTLTLGGAQATNYTVTGFSGSVLITNGTSLLLTSSSQTNADQIPVAFAATVLANGTPAVHATGSVTFLTNGAVFCTSNLVNGTASTPFISNLPVGVNSLTARYAGDANYSGSTNTLNQVVLQQASSVTFSNSLVAITFTPSGAITTIIRKDTGENKNFDSPGFYIWNEQYGTGITFAKMVQIAPNVMLFSTADGHYNVTIRVTCEDRYMKFGLVNVSDCPSGGTDTNWPGLSVAFKIGGFNYFGQTSDAWQIYAVTLDPMVDVLTTVPVFALWPYVQYSQANAYAYPYNNPNSQTTHGYPLQPMGALAIFTATSDAQHDDILYDIWGGEPSLPEPNRANLTNGWNRATAQAWVTRWESELPPAKLLMFIPTGLDDLYGAADAMYAAGLNGLYIFDYYWKGQAAVDSINPVYFPHGLSDVTALQQYCTARGISLYFHWSSVFVNYADPLYGANSPTGVSPDLARWGTGTLLGSVNSGSTSFDVQPDAGYQLMIAPPPWGGYDQWASIGGLSDSYPPYYTGVYSSILNINNDLIFGSPSVVNSTDWSVSGVNRSGVSQFGNSWGMNHAAGSKVDFLLSEGGSFIPDSRSVLFTNLAVRYATLLNQEQVPEADYDSLEQNQDLGNWGPRRESQALYEALDHPVHANSSFGNAPWGHFEYNFASVQKHEGGTGFAIEASEIGGLAELRLADPSLMATHLDEDQWAFGSAAGYSPNFMIAGYHVGTDLNTINHQGEWSQVISNLNLWVALAPYLTTNEQAILKSHSATSLSADFYVPSVTNAGWRLTPTEAMLRPGVDAPWQLMVESGPLSPHQFLKVGDTLSGLTNPYASQTPQIELLVLPGMTAANAGNVSLLPASPLYFTTPTPYSWNCTQFGTGAPVDMSHSRGVAITLTGDNSGSVLVLNIGGRYYAVTVDFSGTKTVEIPNGEVELYRYSTGTTGYGYIQSQNIGTFDYTRVGNFAMFLGYVPAGVNPNIQVSAVKTMAEDQATGLVNPVLTLNGMSATISGTIPYNDYVVYGGGSTAGEYDANWNFVTTLPVSGSALTAANGNNTFSVGATGSPNTCMATRIKVSGTPWVINKPAPTHEWRFENNTLDTAGTANGTAVNGPAYVPGIEGAAALSFNGLNQYVNIANISDFQFTKAQSFTLSAWVKLNRLPDAQAGIMEKNPAAGAWYGLGITAANQWAFFGATNIASSFTADLGQWHSIIGVQDGAAGTRKLYVDGRGMASGMAQDASGSGALGIGAAPGTVPGQFLNGSVDDVRIYNQALAQPDISLLATNLAAAANSILTCSVSGNQLILDWPANQLWQLQTQTNSLGKGLTTNWFTVTGAGPPWSVTINPASPTVFYRLTHP